MVEATSRIFLSHISRGKRAQDLRMREKILELRIVLSSGVRLYEL